VTGVEVQETLKRGRHCFPGLSCSRHGCWVPSRVPQILGKAERLRMGAADRSEQLQAEASKPKRDEFDNLQSSNTPRDPIYLGLASWKDDLKAFRMQPNLCRQRAQQLSIYLNRNVRSAFHLHPVGHLDAYVRIKTDEAASECRKLPNSD
jgi:hypothetical protein